MGELKNSKAYYMGHILLRNKVFSNINEIMEKLKLGPDVIKKYLIDLWNSIDEKCFKEGTKIIDIEKKLDASDINITFREINNNYIYFISFSDFGYYDAQLKSVAIILGEKNIRYITLEVPEEMEFEILKNMDEQQKREMGMNEFMLKYKYMVGEWIIDENNYFKHINYGPILNDPTIRFVTKLEDLLK